MKKILILFLIFSGFAFTQVRLKGRVINDKKEPQKNLSIRFPLIGDAVTTSAGEFIIALPAERDYVDVSVADEKYELLYPIDGKIPVPADPNFVTTLIIAEKNNSAGSVDISVKKYEEMKDILKEFGTTSSDLKQFLEKFIEIESARLEMDRQSLRSALDTAEKRDELFSTISPLLTEYQLRVKNIKTAFETSFDIAFKRQSGIEILNRAVREYKPVFDSLYNNQKKWHKNISDYWGESLAEKFSSSTDYAFNEIHKSYVFQLNNAITKLNNINFGVVDDDEAEDLMTETKNEVKLILNNLDIRIPIMEERFNELISRLQFAEL